MNAGVMTNLILAIAVVGLVLFRQLTPRQVTADAGWRLLLILGAVGVVQLGQFIDKSGWIGMIGIGLLAGSFGLAAIFGTLRAGSMTIWQERDGSWWRRGGVTTLVLWAISIGSHFGIDALAAHLAGPATDIRGLGNATLLLYLAISLGLQNLLVGRRVAVRVRGQRTVSPGI